MSRSRAGGWLLVLAAALAFAAAGCDTPPAQLEVGICTDYQRGPARNWFTDVSGRTGIDIKVVPDHSEAGGGVAVADVDGDGLLDIAVSARRGGFALYRNLGGFRFQDITARAGLTHDIDATAVAFGDLDNDGDEDLVVASPEGSRVFENIGGGRFREVKDALGQTGFTEHILLADFDGDGLLDLYASNHDYSAPTASGNLLFRNVGGLKFQNITSASGVGALTLAGKGAGLSWSASAFDADGDGKPDIYVANDAYVWDFGDGPPVAPPGDPNINVDGFYLNQGRAGASGVPVFSNATVAENLELPKSSMGGLIADFDGDGRLDIYVPNYGQNKLYLNRGNTFVERSRQFGVGTARRITASCDAASTNRQCVVMSWSAALEDFNLDGHDELMVANGISGFDQPAAPVQMFVRDTDTGPFEEVSPQMGCPQARGLVAADLDNDGDLDVVMSTRIGTPRVYETEPPHPGGWLRVRLRGRASNRDGIGARVTAELASGRRLLRLIGGGGIIGSSAPAEADFGLGADSVARLVIDWPSGAHQVVANPGRDREVVIDEAGARGNAQAGAPGANGSAFE